MFAKENPGAGQDARWSIEIHHDYSTAEGVWRHLEEVGRCTPFQTYDWVTTWYESVGHSKSVKPLIVVASRNRSPEVILPLCAFKKGNLNVISIPDLGASDYAGPVLAPGALLSPPEVRSMMSAVLAALPASDVLHFNKLAEQIDGVPNPLCWLRGVGQSTTSCFGVDLEKCWTKQAERIMERPLLSTIRRRRAQIGKKGTLSFDRASDPEALAPVWEVLLEMRLERFRRLGREDILADAVWQRFYKSLATRAHRTLDISIATMKLDGKIIASCYGVTRGSTYYMLIPAFQMGEWDRFMPGMQLFYEMMRAHAAAGMKYFDFTIGDEGYKVRFGAKRHPLYQWLVPRSPKGVAAFGAWRLKLLLARSPKLFELARKARAVSIGLRDR